jgi:hypothetical protein
VIVAAGASSISQWPAFGTTISCTLVAALRSVLGVPSTVCGLLLNSLSF